MRCRAQEALSKGMAKGQDHREGNCGGAIVSKKLPTTPRSKVRAALRLVFLRSRERQARLKADKYTCVRCGRKQSKAKGKEVSVEVHHINPIDSNWEYVIDYIMKYILVSPSEMKTLCKDCHEKEHQKLSDL
jgi:5-methylcytosine-specific restriction endonuclease McrA